MLTLCKNKMLLMCSALITFAYSFPTDLQKNITITHQNATDISNAKENERPLTLIVEEKDPKADSVVVEFVYTSNGGNSIVQITGNDKDKYVIENPGQEENKHKRLNENNEREVVQRSTQKIAQRYINERKSDTSKVIISPLASLVPEEQSPLLSKWPKHLYDAFNPTKPFPELDDQKPNQIIADKIMKGNGNTYLSNGQERKTIPYVAGPQLNPLSIYDREFYVPIFD